MNFRADSPDHVSPFVPFALRFTAFPEAPIRSQQVPRPRPPPSPLSSPVGRQAENKENKNPRKAETESKVVTPMFLDLFASCCFPARSRVGSDGFKTSNFIALKITSEVKGGWKFHQFDIITTSSALI